MQEMAYIGRRDAPVLDHVAHGGHHRGTRVLARAHDLGGEHRLAHPTAHHVGESAADVDADVEKLGHWHCLYSDVASGGWGRRTSIMLVRIRADRGGRRARSASA